MSAKPPASGFALRFLAVLACFGLAGLLGWMVLIDDVPNTVHPSGQNLDDRHASATPTVVEKASTADPVAPVLVSQSVSQRVLDLRQWPSEVDPASLANELKPWSLAGQYRSWKTVYRPERLPDRSGQRITTTVPGGRTISSLASCWSTSDGFWCSQEDILDALASSVVGLQPHKTADVILEAARLAIAFGHPELALDVVRSVSDASGKRPETRTAIWHYALALSGRSKSSITEMWCNPAYAQRHAADRPLQPPADECPAWLARMLDVAWCRTANTDEICASLRKSIGTLGQWSPLTVDTALLLLEKHDAHDPGIRPQTLVWIALQAGRVYGPTRSFAMWPWIQRLGVSSTAQGKALHHDRFNAAESVIYASLCLEDAWELRRLPTVQHLMMTMGDVSLALATASGVQTDFEPTWEHRLMIERCIWRNHHLLGIPQKNIPRWISGMLEVSSQVHQEQARLQFSDFLRVGARDAQQALAIVDGLHAGHELDVPMFLASRAFIGVHYGRPDIVTEARAWADNLVIDSRHERGQKVRHLIESIAERKHP